MCSVFLSGVAAVVSGTASVLKEGMVLERREHGQGSYEADLLYEVPELKIKEIFSLHVEDLGLSDEECIERLEAAKEEIDQTFPAGNSSIQEIREDVFIAEDYQNGEVLAEWSFDNYKYISAAGEIWNEGIPAEGIPVKADVELTCGKQKQLYEFVFCIYPPIYSEEEKIRKKIEEVLKQQSARTQEGKIELPEEIMEKKVKWEQQKDWTPVKILIFGVVIACFIPFVERSRLAEEERKQREQMQMEYPAFVSKLTILMGSGMTLFMAWKKIAESYVSRRENEKMPEHPLYEEICVTCREVESGMGEQHAYERFAERIGLQSYRKLCSILTQNMRKGTAGLLLLLEKECQQAFEERKNIAKKYGEEAGTKLLFPMMLMFGIIVAVIMIPAMMTF